MSAILPVKMSDLLEIAVNDAQIIQKTPGYKLAMGIWHSPDTSPNEEVCYVCMAGAVMANTLDVPKDTDSCPDDFEDLYAPLMAIDDLRQGNFPRASVRLDLSPFPQDLEAAALKALGNWSIRLNRYPFQGYMKAVEVLRRAGW